MKTLRHLAIGFSLVFLIGVAIWYTLQSGIGFIRQRIRTDTMAYRVLSVEILSGEKSRVSDGDTYIIVAQGAKSIVHAEGYDYIRAGEILCEGMPGLLFGKYDSAKPCDADIPTDPNRVLVSHNAVLGQPVDAPSVGSKMFHITSEHIR